MSFFDDEDDAIEEEPRRVPREGAAPRPRSAAGPSRSGSRSGPPRRGGDQAIERRRLVAIGVVVVVIILLILLISSCQSRSTRNSLEDYNNSVSQIITQSDATGAQVFKLLSSGQGGSAISQALATPLGSANTQLQDAKGLSTPGQMASAERNVVLALQMRYDGIQMIARAVQQVTAGGSGASSAVSTIAAGMARFYSSDVVYKGYAVNEIAEALNGDNIDFGSNSNLQINGGQFLTDLGWLSDQFIATELGTTVTLAGGASSGSSAGVNSTTPGLHGESLDSVSVGSNTLATGVTNTVPGSPAPTFQISVTDGGAFPQYGITCSVDVSGGPSGSSTIKSISANGGTATCDVKLSGTVTPGEYQVTVTISKVPLETNTANNTATYTVSFE